MKPTRSVLIGLAVLHRMYVDAKADPYPKSGELRAILALLHALSGGDRHPFDDYWRSATRPTIHVNHSQVAMTCRKNDLLASWHGILRAFGWTSSITLMDAIRRADVPERPPIPPAEQTRL